MAWIPRNYVSANTLTTKRTTTLAMLGILNASTFSIVLSYFFRFSQGWIKCGECADLTGYDFSQLTEATDVPLVATRGLQEPKAIDTIRLESRKGAVNMAFGKKAKHVREHFAKMDAKAVEDVEKSLRVNREFILELNGSFYRLTPEGWIDCVVCADRSGYDLSRYTKPTGFSLVATRRLPDPKAIDVVRLELQKDAVNKAFKKEAKNVREHFAKMDAKAIEDVKESLETNGEFLLKINGSSYRLIPDMVQVKQLQETLHMEEFVTNVTGASFDIDHIFYVIFEHNFRVRNDGDQKTVLNYHPFLSIFYFSPFKKTIPVPLAASHYRPFEVFGLTTEHQPRTRSSRPPTL